MGWLLAVHLGAGRYGESSDSEAAYVALLREALEKGRQLMREESCDDAAVTHAVRVASGVVGFLERHELTNCGRGSNLTERGAVECEASVACGKTRAVGACAGVRGVAEPSALARELMARTVGSADVVGREPPLVVVGDGARAAAKKLGLEIASEEELADYQVTSQAKWQWRKWHERCSGVETIGRGCDDERLDTVGAVCIDADGNTAASISSGGVLYKVPGRVGLAGCPRMGCDARNFREKAGVSSNRKRRRDCTAQNGFAIACTGRGEHFIRSAFVTALAGRLREGESIDEALRSSFDDAKDDNDGIPLEGGALALTFSRAKKKRSGRRRRIRTDMSVSDKPNESSEEANLVQIGVALTTPCMAVGFLEGRMMKPKIEILRQPDRHDRQLVVHVSCLEV